MSFLFCLHSSRPHSHRSQRECCVGHDCVRICVARRGQSTVLAWGAQWSRGQNRRRPAEVGRAGFYPRDWGQVLLKTFMTSMSHLIFSSENSSLGPEMGCLLKQCLDETLLSMLLQFMLSCTCGLIYLLGRLLGFIRIKTDER